MCNHIRQLNAPQHDLSDPYERFMSAFPALSAECPLRNADILLISAGCRPESCICHKPWTIQAGTSAIEHVNLMLSLHNY